MTPNEILSARKEEAEKLKAQRVRKSISITELSHRSGISRHTIYRLESGQQNFSIDLRTLYLNGLKKQTL